MNGSLQTADGRSVLRFERRLPHPVEKVWRAITDPDELAAWFPAQLVGEREPGAKIRFVFPAGPGPASDERGRAGDEAGPGGDDLPGQDGEILEYQPPRLFAYTWGDSVLRWELQPDGPGCRLLFSHTFADRPAAASYATGWHGCLDALDRLLAGRPATTPAGDAAGTWAYRMRHEAYVEVFGLLGGSAEQAADGGQIRFERLFPYPPDRVWAALTGDAEPVTGEPAPAAAAAEHAPPGPVTQVRAGVALAFRADAGEVHWALSPGPGGTLVALTQQVPAADRVAALVGWHQRLETLAGELAAADASRPEPAELLARYVEQVGRYPEQVDDQ